MGKPPRQAPEGFTASATRTGGDSDGEQSRFTHRRSVLLGVDRTGGVGLVLLGSYSSRRQSGWRLRIASMLFWVVLVEMDAEDVSTPIRQ